MTLPWPAPGTWIRLVITVGLGVVVWSAGNLTEPLARALVQGALLADLITWLAYHAVRLPWLLADAAYGTVLNVALALAAWQLTGGQGELHGEAMAVAFLAGLLVTGLKAGWYALLLLDA